MTPASTSFCMRCGAHMISGAQFCPRCGTSIPVPPADAVTTVAIAPGDPHDKERNALLAALRHATLGEYEILAELGRGGMATVYLAHDIALDRKVAIKVLAPALLQMGEGMVERFKREARTAAALSHPHIIPIYAVKERDGVLYFVMKYVEGRPLDSIIRDVGALPVPMVRTIVAQVSDALSYAHRHGVIHRDIKAPNIMLDEEGWAVVTDFGIAKVMQAEGLTITGVTVGTPAYMSPEQCATGEVGGASDQYSLGVVAYEMLTGKLPFHGASVMSVMYAHFNERPRDVTELRRDCPPNLAACVMRMLEKDPVQRWPSMDDVVAACGRRSLRQDDPVRGQMITLAKAGGRTHVPGHMNTPTSPIPPAKRPTRPRAAGPAWRFVPALWGTLAAVAIGVALWWTAPWREPQTPATPPRAPARDTVAAVGTAPSPGDTTARSPLEAPASRAPAQRSTARARVPPRAASADSQSRGLPVPREDSLVRALRAAALAAMSRALEARAAPAELAKGEAAFHGAESLATQGRLSEAMVQLVTAASLWGEAERSARSRAASDTARQRPAEPAAAAPPPADPRLQIEAVIGAYARALESLDLSEVRRVCPGLTTVQQDGLKQFFRSVRKLSASLAITALNVVGDRADASVTGVYAFENATTRRTERLPVAFRAILLQNPDGWRLTSIR